MRGEISATLAIGLSGFRSCDFSPKGQLSPERAGPDQTEPFRYNNTENRTDHRAEWAKRT
jgi:hypothetical protein